MEQMRLYIKNMVSHCCILMVKEKLNLLGLIPNEVVLGEIHMDKVLSAEQIQKVKEIKLNYESNYFIRVKRTSTNEIQNIPFEEYLKLCV